MASRNIVIKNNTRCFKSALQWSLDFSFLVLYILADLISFLEIQSLQLAGSSSTVFAVNLILTRYIYFLPMQLTENLIKKGYIFKANN